MSAIETLRDALFGNPPSPTTEPSREGTLAAFTELYDQVVVGLAAASQGITTVATTAARDTFYATPENQSKLVYVNNNNGSASDPANGVYEYVSGAARLAQGFYAGVTVVVQPLVDEALDAAELAEAWSQSPTAPDPSDPTSKSAKTWVQDATTHLDQLDQSLSSISAIGLPIGTAPVTGSSVSAAAYLYLSPATEDRQIFEINAYNLSVVGGSVKLRRFTKSGSNYVPVSGAVDRTISLPPNASGAPSTVAVSPAFSLKNGEYLVFETTTGAITYQASGGGQSGGVRQGTVGTSSIADGSASNLRFEISFHYRYQSVTADTLADLTERVTDAEPGAAKGSDVFDALKVTGTLGIAAGQSPTPAGTAASSGTWTFATPMPRKRYLKTIDVYNPTATAKTIRVVRQQDDGTNLTNLEVWAFTSPDTVGWFTYTLETTLQQGQSVGIAGSANSFGFLSIPDAGLGLYIGGSSNPAVGASYAKPALSAFTLLTRFNFEEIQSASSAGFDRLKAWKAAFKGLDFRAVPKVMSNPPAMTIGANGAVSAITGAANNAPGYAATSANISLVGGAFAAQADASYRYVRGGRVRFLTDSPRFELRLRAPSGMRGVSVLIDGELVSGEPWPAGMVTGGDHLVLFDFGSNVQDFYAISGSVGAGGSGYAVGDEITLAGGTATTPTVVKVMAVSSGAVTAFAIKTKGTYSATPSNNVAQASTTGSGTGATFSMIWTRRQTTKKERAVEVILGATTWFGGINVETGSTVSPWPVLTGQPRFMVVGDSVLETAYPDTEMTFGRRTAYIMGLQERYEQLGVSGMGWAVPGNAVTTRVASIVGRSPDLLEIPLGRNDWGNNVDPATLTSTVTDVLNQILGALPSVKIAVTTGWNSNTTYQNAVLNGVLAASDQSRLRGINLQTYGIGENQAWQVTDNTHYGEQGQQNLAVAIAPLVANAFMEMIG